MVKVINIDTKTRTIRVENAADGDIKTWRTTESGAHFPIKKGESTKEALDKFVEKKRGTGIDEKVPRNLPPELKKKEQESAKAREKLQKDLRKDVFGPAKKESGLLGNRPTPDEQLKTPKAREVYDRLTRYAAEHNKDLQEDDMKHLRSLRDILLDDNNAAEHVEKNFQKWFGSSKQQPAKPSKKADVSDIIKSYKEKMAALGPKASIKKTDRVEADAIKEFMTRKLGANRPYDDYYQYWLNGMDKKTRDEFEEIYGESEAREMAFSELASDVDHSGLARGEPTYDELMQWAKKQKQTSQKETKSSKFDSRTLDRKLVRGGLSDSEIDDLARMQDYYDISDETINAAIDAGEYSVKEIFKRLRNYDDDFATHLSDFREDYQKATKQPKQSSQPTSYDLDDAFDEADLGSEWGRAKHRMDFHGVSQYTIKDIIDSGKYEAGDIIEALESNSHDKIDEMRKSLKNK